MNGEWWVVLVSTALTLFYSVAHYALHNPSRVKLEHAFDRRNRAGRLLQIERHFDSWLLTTAIVRALCHLMIALAMLRLFGLHLNWASNIGALALAAVIIAVFGIGVPYAWAKYAGEETLATTWPVLLATQYLFWPVTQVMKGLDVIVRRLSGHQEPENHKTSVLEQEILQLATEGQAEGAVDPDEMQMIESVIEFGDIKAGEIMTPRTEIVAVDVTAGRDECRRLIVHEGHSRIPVYEDTLDKIVGVLYAKDLLRMDPAAQPFNLRATMRKAFFVPETKSLSDLLKEFRRSKIHMAIVLDEYGGTAGLVTIEDLLEEIVGEIADEYEPSEPDMLKRIDPQTVEVDARMYIDDLNDALEIQLPEDEDYDTVGGFVFSTLGYIPKSGEEFDYKNLHFTILEAEERKINLIRLRVSEPAEPAAEAT